MRLLAGPAIDEPLEYGGRYWGIPGRLFHKETLYAPINHYMYLGEKMYVQDTLQVIKLTMMRDDVVKYTLNSIFNKHKNWKLVYTPQGPERDINSNHMHSIVQNVTGFFKNIECTSENIERFQHFILKKRQTLVSPSLVWEMLKFYKII